MTGELAPAGEGCEVCSEGWFSGRFPPQLSPFGGPELLHRCAVCGTYWVQDERRAYIVSRDEARRRFPDIVLA